MSPTSNTNTETPCIYVACLAAYNNGKLHGARIDALNNDPDEIMAEVQVMLKASPEPNAEEWALHDNEGFEGIHLSEWEGFAQVHMLAQFIDAYGRLGAALVKYVGDAEHAHAMMQDGYAGCYTSIGDFAEELTSGTIEIPDNLAYYIDHERMGQDMEMNGDFTTIETAHDEVHIFWNH